MGAPRGGSHQSEPGARPSCLVKVVFLEEALIALKVGVEVVVVVGVGFAGGVGAALTGVDRRVEGREPRAGRPGPVAVGC